MNRYLIGICLFFSSGCSMLGQQVDVGNISAGDVFSVGADAYKAATLSEEEVKKMATEVAQHEDANHKVAPVSSTYGKRLAKVVSRYHHEDGIALNYKVYIDPEVNAFSLADGTIRVNSGLMDKMNDEELLFVIGHEIGHIKNGHSKTRMQRAYAASAATKAVGSGLSSGAGSSIAAAGVALGGDLITSLASEVITAQFSQGDETESDEYGLQFISNSGHNSEAAVHALLKLADGSEGGGAGGLVNKFTSTHPAPVARAEHMKELIAGGIPTKETAPTTAVASSIDAPAHSNTSDERATASSVAIAQPEGSLVAASAAAPESHEPRLYSAQGGWVIQVGAFSKRGNALKVIESLSLSAPEAQLEESLVSGAMFHRVVVGPFPSKSVAQRHLNDLLGSATVDRHAFVRPGTL